ncbi:hypothetical protein M422DRAFT_256346 [Sphaerobolus stellatus SS14]|uniref:Unplaced genomic scaffold SPHSTscaffold_67, whole genome shotgun sequence n=1 Tax=Sphaerobolus stellatus (strain SS14) TaxID=990650 RepID=A0A0C9VQU5_SPHS4|nr:hypothetical protein M422DRAFT_256346 [Sphaerobolus stellatus SS14]
MISNRHSNGVKSPQFVSSTEKIVLSAFDFRIPYAMNQRIFLAPYGKWFRLIGRASISEKEEDGCSMDYRAVLVHTDRNGEEKVVIPVLDIFFEENFDLPPPSTPLPSLPASALTFANPPLTPSMHHYPPSTRHIEEQLGEAHQSQTRTWKQLMKDNWLRIFVVVLCIVTLCVFIPILTFN